jgi:hypothetical protein
MGQWATTARAGIRGHPAGTAFLGRADRVGKRAQTATRGKRARQGTRDRGEWRALPARQAARDGQGFQAPAAATLKDRQVCWGHAAKWAGRDG